jgi:hypothetical protein
MYNMSSFRTFALKKTLPTNVTTPQTICYYDTSLNDDLPIPFTVRDGVLDIAIQDNVQVDLLTPATFDDEGNMDETTQPDYQASLIGGNYLVDSLGPNMLTFLKNFIAWENTSATDYNLVTDIEIYNTCTMTKLRFNYITDEYTYKFSDVAPGKITPDPLAYDASSSNSYRVVAIFKTPLVISYKFDGSNTKYVTFISAFDSI